MTATATSHQVAWRFIVADNDRLASWLTASHDDGRRIVDVSSRDLLDIYLETEDWRLHRAGLLLRLRCTTVQSTAATHYEAQLEAHDGLVTSIAPLANARAVTLREAGGELGHCVRSIAGRRPLHPLCELRTRREIYVLEQQGEHSAAVHVDAVNDSADLEGEPRFRVEVQTRPADRDRLAGFVEAMQRECAFEAEVASPLSRALALRGVVPVESPALGPTAIEPEHSVASAAYAVLRAHFTTLWKYESRVRLGEDTEAVHQMRVATRRLRAALQLFEDVLPPRRQAWLRDEFRWLGGVLGVVRDLDVLSANLRAQGLSRPEIEQAALPEILARFEGRRAAAQVRLLEEMDSERYERLIAVTTLALQRGIPPRSRAARLSVGAGVPRRITRLHRAVRKLAARIEPESPLEQLHDLRIRCKQLRYAMECFGSVYGKPAKKFSRDLAAIQSALGLQQDAAVAAALRTEVATWGEVTPASAVALELFVREAETRALAVRLRLEELLAGIDGKTWKRLRRAMRRCRRATVRIAVSRPQPRRRRGATAPLAAAVEPAPAEVVEARVTDPAESIDAATQPSTLDS